MRRLLSGWTSGAVANEKPACRVLFAVMLAGLYLRLVLALFSGYAPDTNWMIKYVAYAEKSGLTSVTDIWEHTLYPPLFVYEAVAASKVINKLSGQHTPQTDSEVTPWARLGVRIIPIACDLLIAGLLFVALSRSLSATVGVLAASLYLFNPGVVANSALWNYDSIPSFLMLLALVLCGLGFEKGNDFWFVIAAVVSALAFSAKVQAGMFLPALGAFLLWNKSLRTMVKCAVAFCVVAALSYAPFIAQGRWDYFERVFIMAFKDYPVTHVSGYNIWALWFQRPVSARVLGISLENIGRIAYFAAAAFAVHALLTRSSAGESRADALRKTSIVATYLSVAPFLVLTRMHERYFAPAVALALLAGFLDNRLKPAGLGFSLTYAANMLAIGLSYWKPWSYVGDTAPFPEPVRLALILTRVFGSVLNLALFGSFTLKLHTLLATEPVTEVSLQPQESLVPV